MHGLFDAAPIGGIVMRGGVYIATIDAADRAIAKERPAEIEIEMPDEPGILLAGGADGGSCGRVSRTVLLWIGSGMAHTDQHRPGRDTASAVAGSPRKVGSMRIMSASPSC